MGIFSFFTKKQPSRPLSRSSRKMLDEVAKESAEHDYLGKAANARHKAQDAVKAHDYDAAWGYYHEEKISFLSHAERAEFTKRQTQALEASVHEGLANILRLEKKHDEALAHILYWVVAQNNHPKKAHQQKLKAYFNRCKFEATSFDEVISFSIDPSSGASLPAAQCKVLEWQLKG